VRRREKKGSIYLLYIAKHHRNRLLLVILTLASLLALGLQFLEKAKFQQVRAVKEPVTHPETQPRPPTVEGTPAGPRSGGDPNGEDAQETRTSPLPAPAESCDDLRVLVDPSHPLPPDYVPGDLVSLWAYGVPTLGGDMLLRRDAAEHLSHLVAAATADGEELVVASAYRSYAQQQASHGRLASVYGAGADGMSAPPGHSQHQLGTAVDFTNSVAAYQVQPIFGQTSAAWWLQNHATQYGFVLSYPPGKDETGYQFEPWHYRYIGVENAGRLQESDLTMQEFLLREGVLPDC
jgi:D-alanyl-D-alanine carboxypeptidase